VTIGTLRLEIGKKDDAKIAYDMAIENCDKLIKDMAVQTGEEYKKLMAIRITARFNLGYWHEMNLDLGEATLIYKDIIREEVTYLDAYLRLAYMANKRGNFERAFALLEDSKKNVTNQRPVYQYCIKGKMLAENHFTEESVTEFKTL
jgi:tetratricopeptide (TPR) repeat protein